jgi:hypothetical protein
MIATVANPKRTGTRRGYLRQLANFATSEREVIFAFVFSRVLIWTVGWLSLRWFKPGGLASSQHGQLWEMFFRWDSGWYLAVLNDGYYLHPGHESSAAFFPLYPLTASVVSHLFAMPIKAAGFLVSNLALLVAAILLRRLALIDHADRPKIAMRSVWLLMLSPVAHFFSSFYTESLFLFLSLLAFYGARRGRWALAGAAGALLTATRTNGIVILPALAWEAWRQHREVGGAGTRSRPWGVAWLALVPLGLIGYMTYLHFHVGDAFAFVKAQAAWGKILTVPGKSLWAAYQGYPKAYAFLFIGATITSLVILILGFRYGVRRSMLIYTILTLLLILSTSLLEGMPRYVSVLFPLYIALALATERSENAFTAVIAFSTALMALTTALFVCGYWMT